MSSQLRFVSLGWQAAGVVALLAAAAVLGKEIAKGSLLPALAMGTLVVGVLVLQRRLWLLVPMTTAALVLGSSSFPFARSTWMLAAKFALMTSVAATVLPSALDHLRQRISIGFAIAFLGLVGLATLSTFHSFAPGVTFEHAGSLFILWLATAVAVPLGCKCADDFMRLLRSVGFVAAMAVLVGIWLTFANGLPPSARFQGIFGNANTIGYFVPVFTALVLMAAHEYKRRGLLVVTAALIFIGLLLSGSRAGLLSALFGVAVGLAVARHAKRAVIVAVTCGAVIAGLFAVWDRPVRPVGEGVLQIGTGSYRLEAWGDGLRLISNRPLTGYGFATTPVVFPELGGAGSNLGRLHNSYLEMAMDLGWPGATLMTLLALSGLAAAWRVSRAGDDWRRVGALLIAGIAGGMMEGVFESGLLAAGGLLAFHFWILIAAAHALRARARILGSTLQ